LPKGVPLSEKERKNRRKQIFTIASELFLKKGFNETTMQDIAEANRMGKSTLYDYFKDKDEVLLFFLEEEMKILNEQSQAVIEKEKDIHTRLKKIIKIRLDFYKNKSSIALLLIYQAQRLSQQSINRWMERREEYLSILQKIINEGTENGIFREVNPRFAAQSLFNLVALMFLEGFMGDTDEVSERVLDLFINGVSA
jgi:AcrR family transcriptional regulator